jgi:hypothetical protein
MTTVDETNLGNVMRGDRWRLLIAMLVYAGVASAYPTLSTSATARALGLAVVPGSAQDFVFIGVTFASIVASAIGFMLLAALLDIWTGRQPQPLAAMNLGLPAAATFELIKPSLLILAFQVWFWLSPTH